MRFQINRINVDDPGGMLMPGRLFSSASGYRYGFNGKENDNEVKGASTTLVRIFTNQLKVMVMPPHPFFQIFFTLHRLTVIK